MRMSIHPPRATGASLAAVVAKIAAIVDEAGVDVRGIKATPFTVTMRLADENDVDDAAALFTDADPDSGASVDYSRSASVDGMPVSIYATRTHDRCTCFRQCADHEPDPDGRYGRRHRPEPEKVPGGWRTACRCGCDRAQSVGWYASWLTARDESAHLLTLAEHGPGREASA